MSTDSTNLAEIKAINCTSCAATLNVLGGHRVKSLTCGYCGSVMDRHADFKLLQRYRKKPDRPYVPLALGMQAEFRGVPFTIIGMIGYVSHQSGPGWAESYEWVSFQLYSPTHGYAWLTWNKGHYLFSYRTREQPHPSVPGILMPKMKVTLDNQTFRMFERYVAEIDYVEGELTWIAKRGDKVRVVEAIDPPFMFNYEQSERELEYSIGEYADADAVHAAFDIDPPEPPDGIHPAQPFDPGSFWPALGKIGPFFAAIAALLLLITFVVGDGRELARANFEKGSGVQTLPFTATNVDQLLKLDLRASLTNNWVYYDVTVTDAETDEDVLVLGKEISFYKGRDSDGDWIEGSRRATALFKVPSPGDYKIEIEPSEASDAIPPLQIRLYEGVMVKRYWIALLIVSGVAALFPNLRRQMFEKKRWADVLEDDDDD